ncbi:MAG TPA: hypothetical protein VN278_04430 [Methanosarcina sp.]|nr:hypothetical protein [Methanosarcina sp.]
MGKQETGEIAIQALYDLMQLADTGEHLTTASEDMATAWTSFFGTSGNGIFGEFTNLAGNLVSELGCLQKIASYCEEVHTNFLKPLSGLPFVDWGLRFGSRDIIALAALYTQLRINRPDSSQTTTTFKIQSSDLWDQPQNGAVEPELGDGGDYHLALFFYTTNPDNYMKSVELEFWVEGEDDVIESWNIQPPEDEEQEFNQPYVVTGYADYICVRLFDDSGERKSWEWSFVITP